MRPLGSNPFSEKPEILLIIHSLAKTYNRLPSEILDLDLYDLSLAVLCYQEADAASAALVKRLNSDGMPVFPAVILKQ